MAIMALCKLQTSLQMKFTSPKMGMLSSKKREPFNDQFMTSHINDSIRDKSHKQSQTSAIHLGWLKHCSPWNVHSINWLALLSPILSLLNHLKQLLLTLSFSLPPLRNLNFLRQRRHFKLQKHSSASWLKPTSHKAANKTTLLLAGESWALTPMTKIWGITPSC